MASAAEQLVSNINLSAFSKATELKNRLWFTLGALIIYRLGTYLPLPGIDPVALGALFQRNSGGILGMFDMFSGGALQRMSIFALNIMPYISASIIVQLLTAVLPSFEAMKKEGEVGRKKLNQYTRMGTVFLSAVQAFGIAVGLESAGAGGGGGVVVDPGLFFRFTTVVTLVGGTMFLMWLGEQITARGVGNGISLIIFSGIVARMPFAIGNLLELSRVGEISVVFVLLFFVIAVATITFIVFMERAQRRILVQYPKRQVGNKMFGGEASHLPLKLNTSGVIPPIFASSLLLLPATFLSFNTGEQSEWMSWFSYWFAAGRPGYIIAYVLLILFFCFFYTAIVFNPTETADNLRKYGGFVPGYRPGKITADYLDYVLTRLTVVGSLYLAAVCVLPELARAEYAVPFGGTSILIVVSVTMDTVAQIHSHLLAHQYEGLIKKAKLRGRRG
jgi:preprotein translocase subunit SecY